MSRSLIPALLLGVALAGATGFAEAKSIKDAVPASALADFCTEHGVGSETKASLDLTNGTTVTGSIHCEAEDLVAGSDDPVKAGINDQKGARENERADEHHDDGEDLDDEGTGGDDHEDEVEDHSGHDASDESGDHDSGDHDSEDHDNGDDDGED